MCILDTSLFFSFKGVTTTRCVISYTPYNSWISANSGDTLGIFSHLSAFLKTLTADGETIFSGSISINRPFFLFLVFPFFRLFRFWTCFFCAHHEGTNQAPIPNSYLRTASTAEQPAVGPAQSSKVHAALRSCRSECDNASEQTTASQVLPRANKYEYLVPGICFFPLFVLWIMRLHNN